jgi:hypothetical protein
VRSDTDTRDSDAITAITAIVRAAVVAPNRRLHLLARWISDLAGRTGDREDRRMFELVAGVGWVVLGIAGVGKVGGPARPIEA